MKAILVFGLVILIVSAAWAQSQNPECNFCVRVCADHCIPQGECTVDVAGYSSAEFTVPCDTVYQVSAAMDCADSGEWTCRLFKACVMLF